MHNQLLDLQHRYNLIEEEKKHSEKEAKELEELNSKKSSELEGRFQEADNLVKEKENKLEEKKIEKLAFIELSQKKSEELQKIKKQLNEIANNNENLIREKAKIEEEIEIEMSKKPASQQELDELRAFNDPLMREHSKLFDKYKEKEQEEIRLAKKLEDAGARLKNLESINVHRLIQTEQAEEDKKKNQFDIERLIPENKRLEEENDNLKFQCKDIERKVDIDNKRLDSILIQLNSKDKEIQNAEYELNCEKNKYSELEATKRKLKTDNENLSSLFGKYKGEINLYKQMREEEIDEKLELEKEKERLEEELKKIELEAKSSKLTLAEAQENQEKNLEAHNELSEELEALKNHIKLLETQNKGVSYLVY